MRNNVSDTIEIFNSSIEYGEEVLKNKIESKTFFRGYIFRDTIKELVSKNSIILDYACGSGKISYLIAKEGYRVHGIDAAQKAIDEAQKLTNENIKLTFEHSNDEGFGLPENKYDAIICSSAIEFFPNPAVLLKNFNKALKSGGNLVISFPNQKSIWRLYAKIRKGKQYHPFKGTWHSWSTSEFKKLLEQEGFSVNRIRYFESIFDNSKILRYLNSIPFVGTLCIINAKKKL